MGARVKATVWLASAMLMSGCTSLEREMDHFVGVWGGSHVGVVFQGGLADVQFDCASGTVDDPLYPAADGSFSGKGTYRTGTSGPIKVGQYFRSQGAIYTGMVAKPAAKGAPRTMTLNVTLEDGTPLGPFTLSEGAPPKITRCA